MVLRSRAIYQVKELVCVPALCRFCRRSRVTSPLRPRARAESVTSACRVLARPAGCRRDPIPGIQPARTPPPAGGRRRLDSGGAARPRSAAAVSSPAARQCRRRDLPGIRPRPWRGPALLSSAVHMPLSRTRVLAWPSESKTRHLYGYTRSSRRLALASRAGALHALPHVCAPPAARAPQCTYTVIYWKCSMLLVRCLYVRPAILE